MADLPALPQAAGHLQPFGQIARRGLPVACLHGEHAQIHQQIADAGQIAHLPGQDQPIFPVAAGFGQIPVRFGNYA